MSLCVGTCGVNVSSVGGGRAVWPCPGVARHCLRAGLHRVDYLKRVPAHRRRCPLSLPPEQPRPDVRTGRNVRSRGRVYRRIIGPEVSLAIRIRELDGDVEDNSQDYDVVETDRGGWQTLGDGTSLV